MRIEYHSTIYPKPSELNHYICSSEIDVWFPSEDGESVVAARLSVDYLDIARAVSAGESILHICDADSSAWMQVYEATIEPDINFLGLREDFGFDNPVFGMVFVHGAVFHPSVNSWRAYILDTICHIFPKDTATVMWKHTTEMEPKELASLGFRRVAGTELLFRPNMLENTYSALSDQREPNEWVVPSEAQYYVDQQWVDHDD